MKLYQGYASNKMGFTGWIRFAERLKKLAEVWRGWVNNYQLANIHSKLKKLDEWLRNRLRNCIWKDWKKPERKRKNLIRLGVDQDHT